MLSKPANCVSFESERIDDPDVERWAALARRASLISLTNDGEEAARNRSASDETKNDDSEKSSCAAGGCQARRLLGLYCRHGGLTVRRIDAVRSGSLSSYWSP